MTNDELNSITAKDGRTYEYTGARPYAVTNDGRCPYSCDANGNMVSRSDGINVIYDYENRISNISGDNIYSYDDKGQRVKKIESDVTTYYFFGNYEETVQAGDILQSIAYDPFGKTVFVSGTENTAYQFTGQELDPGTG